jgi:hypothetical protein
MVAKEPSPSNLATPEAIQATPGAPLGSVPYANVVMVLAAFKVPHHMEIGCEDINLTVYSSHGVPEVLVLGSQVYYRMLQRLADKYSIPIHLFYRPEMIVSLPDTHQ